jgi:hypothetical protein
MNPTSRGDAGLLYLSTPCSCVRTAMDGDFRLLQRITKTKNVFQMKCLRFCFLRLTDPLVYLNQAH